MRLTDYPKSIYRYNRAGRCSPDPHIITLHNINDKDIINILDDGKEGENKQTTILRNRQRCTEITTYQDVVKVSFIIQRLVPYTAALVEITIALWLS